MINEPENVSRPISQFQGLGDVNMVDQYDRFDEGEYRSGMVEIEDNEENIESQQLEQELSENIRRRPHNIHHQRLMESIRSIQPIPHTEVRDAVAPR